MNLPATAHPRCSPNFQARRHFLVHAAAGVLALAAAAQEAREQALTREAMQGIPVLPSRTDPEIKTFDFPHHIYADRDILIRRDEKKPAPRGELLVWMTGTGGRGRGAVEFCRLAAASGYHVVNLVYPSDIPATVCRRRPDPGSFEEFRLCIIQGGECRAITVSRADSMENRLAKLLAHLAKSRAREGWGGFLQADGGLAWEKLALAGQSQGGCHAFLMGMRHRVARVIATGAPKDWSLTADAPAPWLLGESATPKGRFFAFNHEQDHQGCTPDQQWRILREFGLEAFGPRASVDGRQPPFGHSRILSTNHPGGKLESSPAHVSVIASPNAEIFGPVWKHMLTAPVE